MRSALAAKWFPVVALALSLLTGGCEFRVGDPPDEVDVTGVGFETDLPADWVDQTSEFEPRIERAVNTRSGRVKLNLDFAWSGNEAGEQATVAAGRFDVARLDGDLSEYVRVAIQSSERNIPRFAVVRAPERSTLDGEEAMVYEYSGRPFGPVKVRQVMSVYRNVPYVVSLTATPTGFDSFLRSFDEILNSWSWKGEPQPQS